MSIFYSFFGEKAKRRDLNIEDTERAQESTEVVARIFKDLSHYLKLPEIKSRHRFTQFIKSNQYRPSRLY